jgi:hypothetical protein
LFANKDFKFYDTGLSQKMVNIKSKRWKGTDRGRDVFRGQENGRDKCYMGLLIV